MYPLTGFSKHLGKAFFHFIGSLIGEGDRNDA